jgi:hypothetical protein
LQGGNHSGAQAKSLGLIVLSGIFGASIAIAAEDPIKERQQSLKEIKLRTGRMTSWLSVTSPLPPSG